LLGDYFNIIGRVLSDENRARLKATQELHPESVNALAAALGKEQSNISRSLHLMEPYGLLKLVKK